MENITTEQMLDSAYKTCLHSFEQNKEPETCVYIHRNKKPSDVAALPYPGFLPRELSQRFIVYTIRRAREKNEFGGMVMVANAWYIIKTDHDVKTIDDAAKKYGPPSESPDRREGLLLLAWDADLKFRSRAYSVERNGEKFKRLKPGLGSDDTDEMAAYGLSSWILDAFKEEKTPDLIAAKFYEAFKKTAKCVLILVGLCAPLSAETDWEMRENQQRRIDDIREQTRERDEMRRRQEERSERQEREYREKKQDERLRKLERDQKRYEWDNGLR